MLPIEEFKLKISIICISVGNENTDNALPLSLAAKKIFRKNQDIFITAITMMLVIMIIMNDLTSSYSNSSISEIKLNDISLTESPDLSNALSQ